MESAISGSTAAGSETRSGKPTSNGAGVPSKRTRARRASSSRRRARRTSRSAGLLLRIAATTSRPSALGSVPRASASRSHLRSARKVPSARMARRVSVKDRSWAEAPTTGRASTARNKERSHTSTSGPLPKAPSSVKILSSKDDLDHARRIRSRRPPGRARRAAPGPEDRAFGRGPGAPDPVRIPAPGADRGRRVRERAGGGRRRPERAGVPRGPRPSGRPGPRPGGGPRAPARGPGLAGSVLRLHRGGHCGRRRSAPRARHGGGARGGRPGSQGPHPHPGRPRGPRPDPGPRLRSLEAAEPHPHPDRGLHPLARRRHAFGARGPPARAPRIVRDRARPVYPAHRRPHRVPAPAGTTRGEARGDGPPPPPPAPPTPAPPTPEVPTPPRGQPSLSALSPEQREAQLREIEDAYRTKVGNRNHFEVLELERSADAAAVKAAYFRLAKRFHPDAYREPGMEDLHHKLKAVFVRLSEAKEVLGNPRKRGDYESTMPRRTFNPPRAESPEVSSPSGSPSQSVRGWAEPSQTGEETTRRGEEALARAEAFVAEEKYWDAIQALETNLGALAGPRLQKARLLLARAYAKNPKWLRRAQEAALKVTKDDPGNADAYLVLASVYRAGGLESRATAMYRKVLELQPQNKEAQDALAVADAPPPPPTPLLKRFFRKS